MFSSNAGSDGGCQSGAMQIECFVMDLFISSDIGGFELGIKAFLRDANEIGYSLNRNWVSCQVNIPFAFYREA